MRAQQGKKGVRWTGRIALTYICDHVLKSSLVGSCYVTQGTQPGVL